MSGFAGMVSLDGAPADAQLLQRMVERLAFRGPDGTHITTKPGVGFCFTFLRTGPAPQCPSQPCSFDGRVWLLGDVRLDGRNDLRRKLEQHGDEFAAEVTDEELVLRAWRRWGEGGLPDLLGDYAFALWDAEARKLWCARDLMGARPFFYAQAGSHLYFSNTLDAIRCAPDISRELDQYFIGDLLLQDWCSDPKRTAFRNISRLPGGHILRFGTPGIDLRRFVSLPIETPFSLKRGGEYVEQFRVLLEQAVADRLPRGPAAIFMSGGLDSTSVAAAATGITRRARTASFLRAYTIDCRPLFDDDEVYFASIAARSLDIPIETLSNSQCFPFQGFDDMTVCTPEPSSDPFFLLIQRQYRQVEFHGKVAFSGYGGDDILNGQSWPYLVYLLRRLRFGTISVAFGGYIVQKKRMPPLRGGFRARLRRWSGRSSPTAQLPNWIEPDFVERQHLRERWGELQKLPPAVHPIHPRAYAGLSSSFWSGIHEGEDAAWTHSAVESRAPLLDQRLLQFLLRIPPVPWCMEKELLREAVRGVLPDEIRLRPKTPLQGDPLTVYVENNKWSLPPLTRPAAELSNFVDLDGLGAALTTSDVSNLVVHLRAVALNYWLIGIEKGYWIG